MFPRLLWTRFLWPSAPRQRLIWCKILAQLNDDGRTVNGLGRGDDVAFQKTTVVTNLTAPIPRPTVVDPPNSPIMQAVAQANAAKAQGMEVFVVGMAFFSNSMDYMEFDEMASSSLEHHMFDARSPADLSAFLSVAHATMLRKRCMVQQLPDRPAAGAEVALYDAASAELVATTSVGADGSYRFEGLAAGRSYHLVTAHRGVVGPDGVARDYTLMEPGAGSPLLLSVDSNGPESQRVADVLLTIELRGDPPVPVNVCP